MAYSDRLNERISTATARWNNTTRKKMFGGICYLLNGNMFCGIQKNALIVRVGIDAAELALQQPHVKPFSPTGKPMKGWVLVEQPAFQTENELNKWLLKARQFTETLPVK